MSVVDAGVATVFVCFAEDPSAFQRTHPELFTPLLEAWEQIGYVDRACHLVGWYLRHLGDM